ncbi:MAG TPA: hypothetical protein VFM72_04510 [Aequorivita sp.]|nr:hypothetical protein [Aequorivita sp.]
MKKFVFTVAFLCLATTHYGQDSLAHYKRSSLYTFMVSELEAPPADAVANAATTSLSTNAVAPEIVPGSPEERNQVIEEAFTGYPLPDKFNDHNLDLRSIPQTVSSSLSKKDYRATQEAAITQFLNTNNIAKALVAKWFNRSENGGFNMNLVAERGSYNASEIDIQIARESERGMALVRDAGEELIQNTFVVVNDFKYTDKEEVAKKASGILSGLSTVASLAGAGDVSLVADAANVGVGVMGKGYVIKTDAYLFKLVWNEEVAAKFYTDYWTSDKNLDTEKVTAFENSDLFQLEFVGMETAWADLQSTAFTKKTDNELITIATKKAADAVIAKLQRSYEVFRTKTPLMSGDPLAAKIGLKEGLEKGDKYEVLEQIINDDGSTEYKRVGVIKVDKKNIWDNRYMAEEENPSEIKYTIFKGSKNKYYSGMLIRQIN